MKHRLFRLMVSSLLMLGPFDSHVSVARDVRLAPHLTIVGTLVAKSSPTLAPCGFFFPHQLGLYRIDRAYGGELTGLYLVIDHPTCEKDVLADVALGDRVRVSVNVIENYPDVYLHPAFASFGTSPLDSMSLKSCLAWSVEVGNQNLSPRAVQLAHAAERAQRYRSVAFDAVARAR